MMEEVELLRAACCVAGLDGEISEREVVLIHALAERAGAGRASVQAMMDKGVNDPNFYEKVLGYVRREPEQTIKMLFKVALADRRLVMEERVILRHFADRLGLSADRFDEILAVAERAVGAE